MRCIVEDAATEDADAGGKCKNPCDFGQKCIQYSYRVSGSYFAL